MRTIKATLDISRLTRPELEREIRRLAKTANSRLTTLETAKDGRYTKEFVYREIYTKAIQGQSPWIVERDSLNGYGVPRFTTTFNKNPLTGKKMTQGELRAELADLQRFINAQTSTVKGIRAYHKKAYESFIVKYKYDPDTFTYDDWETLFANGALKMANEMFGSEGNYDAINEALSNGISVDTIIERINVAVDTVKTELEAYDVIAGKSMIEKYRDKGWNDANAKGWD